MNNGERLRTVTAGHGEVTSSTLVSLTTGHPPERPLTRANPDRVISRPDPGLTASDRRSARSCGTAVGPVWDGGQARRLPAGQASATPRCSDLLT